MKDNIERSMWGDYIAEFSKRNTSRPTWLQVLGETGAQSEEEGLPLTGVSYEEKAADGPRVQIMLGGDEPNRLRHLTHVIANLEQVTPRIGLDGRDEAIEFVDKNGEASLLIFSHRARVSAWLQIANSSSVSGNFAIEEVDVKMSMTPESVNYLAMAMCP